MTVATQIRTCRTDTCAAPVPLLLSRHGVCLNHYLDDVFTRVTGALEDCQRGQALDSRTLRWLQAQGDMAVRLLSNGNSEPAGQRSRLLELLLCLGNVQQCVKNRGCPKL